MLIDFDYDGVLVDSLARLTRLACEAQSVVGDGRPALEDDLRALPNHTFVDLGRQIGIAEEGLAKFASTLFEIQRLDSDLPEMFQGIPRLLRELARENRVVIVTSSAKAEVEQVLDKASVRDCISCILGGRRAGDKSEKIQWARDRFGRDSERTFMVGDVRSDVREGKRAGVVTVAVTWGYQSRDTLMLESPDYVVDSLEELSAIFGVEPDAPQEPRASGAL